MLGHGPYYNQHFRKYVSAFGTIFNDISIERRDTNGSLVNTIKVPISYAKKDKALSVLNQNPDLKNQWSVILPRMAFYCTSLNYDAERKLNSGNYNKTLGAGSIATMQYSPAPYELQFDLYIWSQYYEDALQIVEQILPFFQPEYTLKVKEVPELGLDRDVPIILNSVAYDDQVEGMYDEGRMIEWTLSFSLRGQFFGPVTQRSVIKHTTETFLFEPDGEGEFVRYQHDVVPESANEDDPHIITETRTEGVT